jgi:hypothetical protein
VRPRQRHQIDRQIAMQRDDTSMAIPLGEFIYSASSRTISRRLPRSSNAVFRFINGVGRLAVDPLHLGPARRNANRSSAQNRDFGKHVVDGIRYLLWLKNSLLSLF